MKHITLSFGMSIVFTIRVMFLVKAPFKKNETESIVIRRLENQVQFLLLVVYPQSLRIQRPNSCCEFLP